MKKSSIVKGALIGAFGLLATAASAQWVPGPAPVIPGAQNTQPVPYHHFKHQVPPCAQQFHRGPKMNFEQMKIYLRGALDLKDSQRPAWDKYITTIEEMHNQKRPDLKKEQFADRQARLQAGIDRLQTKLDNSKKLLQARAELLKVLTPEQAKILDQVENRAHMKQFGPKAPKGQRPAPAPQMQGRL